MTESALKDWIGGRVADYVLGQPLWGEKNLTTYLASEMMKAFPILSKDSLPIEDDQTLLSLTEAAGLLRVAKSTVYKWTSQSIVPHYKPNGRIVYFKRDELLAWAYSRKIYTIEELEQIATRIGKNRVANTKIKL